MPERLLAAIDQTTRYVRETGRVADRFVEFQFSIGDPTLYLEMILPEAAFHEFCAVQRAVRLTPEQGAHVDADRLKWRENQALSTRESP